jgi:hypothetical protein
LVWIISWFLIFALFTWLLAQSYYPVEFRNWPSLLCWLNRRRGVIELFAGVLWIALIGWFLDNAASAQAQEVTFQGLLAKAHGGARLITKNQQKETL